MTLTMWGLLLGALVGIAVMLVTSVVADLRRSDIAVRVMPYLHDVPGTVSRLHEPKLTARAVARLAERVDVALGGATSVRRRLERAGHDATVHDFRVEQVVWGLASFFVAAAFSVVVALQSPGRTVPLLALCAIAFGFGVLLRDNRLSAQVDRRERRILAEFPTVAELLALAVAAGEGPVGALERVTARARGALSDDLGRVLADVRTGVPVAHALDAFGSRSGLPAVARFASGMAVAIERGTPLADVLHAQAADVREAQRRSLIESGARREILMMVPVVFLVLPVTVVFAFWPGVVGLDLVTP
jgi:tight adherence protein C